MATNDLSAAEVSSVVYSYQDAEVTNELYAFGSSLLLDVKNRSEHINAKATTVLGWAIGVLAFLFAESGKINGNAAHFFALCSSLLALLAAVLAFLSLRTRDDWKWPSDKSWFQQKAVKSGDEMRRYHLRVMHEAKQGRHAIVEKKGELLMYAEMSLTLSGLLLFIGLIVKLTGV
jgi:hypothetical protein